MDKPEQQSLRVLPDLLVVGMGIRLRQPAIIWRIGVIPEALHSKYTWFDTYHGQRLHYVPSGDEDIMEFWDRHTYREENRQPESAICGRKGYWRAPGIFSRMGLFRCKRCCDLTGLPRGVGTPFNGVDEILGGRAER